MKHLLIISLIISIIGILILLILSNNLQPEKINLKNINIQNINQKIQTQGTITSIKTFQEQNFQIINIKQDNYSIAVLVNKKTRYLIYSLIFVLPCGIFCWKQNNFVDEIYSIG